ncbi:MAG: phosphatidylglycerophosphatase [Firmicutes bacterium]|nr:phosphatidylglycerophosphatase [Bacillota bacterium]
MAIVPASLYAVIYLYQEKYGVVWRKTSLILQKRNGTILMLTLLLVQLSTLAYGKASVELPDIFSQKNIRIEAGKQINRLLIADADAVVDGVIEEGIIVVDGNLTLTDRAQVKGQIIILRGTLSREVGAQVENTPWIIPIGEVSLRNMAIYVVFVFFIIALFIVPLALWGMLYFMKQFSWYQQMKEKFLALQDHWPVIYIGCSLAMSGSMLIAFSELVWKTMFRQTMGVFDNAAIWLVRYFSSATLDSIMIFITNLGYGYTYALVVASSFLVLIVLKRWIEVKGLLICLLGGAALNELLKQIFERARPDAFRVVEALGYSFPSGHAMVSLCFYGMIAFLIARTIRSWVWRWFIIVSAGLFIFFIGISRIYLGVHYPSDVIAGYTAGATWLAFSISLVMWWERKYVK